MCNYTLGFMKVNGGARRLPEGTVVLYLNFRTRAAPIRAALSLAMAGFGVISL
jgi:hypothetical protein